MYLDCPFHRTNIVTWTTESSSLWPNILSQFPKRIFHCATSRKVPGSITSVAGVFSVASDRSMCPGVDSASKNEYQVNPGGKGGRCVRLTTYRLHVPMSRNLGAVTSWNPVGLLRPVMGQLLYISGVSNSRGPRLVLKVMDSRTSC